MRMTFLANLHSIYSDTEAGMSVACSVTESFKLHCRNRSKGLHPQILAKRGRRNQAAWARTYLPYHKGRGTVGICTVRYYFWGNKRYIGTNDLKYGNITQGLVLVDKRCSPSIGNASQTLRIHPGGKKEVDNGIHYRRLTITICLSSEMIFSQTARLWLHYAYMPPNASY